MKQQYGLYGEYRHSVDKKNRITLPASIRKALAEEEELILSVGFDNCLSIYPNEVWMELLENAGSEGPSQRARQLRRFFSARAQRVSPDSQGRIVVPDRLLEWAGIEDEVTVVGNFNTVELWPPSRWEEYQAEVDPEQAAEEVFTGSA